MTDLSERVVSRAIWMSESPIYRSLFEEFYPDQKDQTILFNIFIAHQSLKVEYVSAGSMEEWDPSLHPQTKELANLLPRLTDSEDL